MGRRRSGRLPAFAREPGDRPRGEPDMRWACSWRARLHASVQSSLSLVPHPSDPARAGAGQEPSVSLHIPSLRRSAFAAALFLVFASTAALADEPAQDLKNVVVTATRTEQTEAGKL